MQPVDPGKTRVVTCPRCKKPVAWSPENPYRPFCSERCKAGDLGAWANDEYRVAAKDDPEQLGSLPFVEPTDLLN